MRRPQTTPGSWRTKIYAFLYDTCSARLHLWAMNKWIIYATRIIKLGIFRKVTTIYQAPKVRCTTSRSEGNYNFKHTKTKTKNRSGPACEYTIHCCALLLRLKNTRTAALVSMPLKPKHHATALSPYQTNQHTCCAQTLHSQIREERRGGVDIDMTGSKQSCYELE